MTGYTEDSKHLYRTSYIVPDSSKLPSEVRWDSNLKALIATKNISLFIVLKYWSNSTDYGSMGTAQINGTTLCNNINNGSYGSMKTNDQLKISVMRSIQYADYRAYAEAYIGILKES